MSRLETTSIRAELPWSDRRNAYTGDKKHDYESTLHYRGWTLVDCGDGWRWAAKDGTTIRVRVCRHHEMQQHDVMRKYHEIVDEREDTK